MWLATLLEHWQPSTPSTLGMKNDVGLAKESAFMLIVLLLILRKFLVVAGNTDKTIRWPIAIIARGGNLMLYMFILESVELMALSYRNT